MFWDRHQYIIKPRRSQPHSPAIATNAGLPTDTVQVLPRKSRTASITNAATTLTQAEANDHHNQNDSESSGLSDCLETNEQTTNLQVSTHGTKKICKHTGQAIQKFVNVFEQYSLAYSKKDKASGGGVNGAKSAGSSRPFIKTSRSSRSQEKYRILSPFEDAEGAEVKRYVKATIDSGLQILESINVGLHDWAVKREHQLQSHVLKEEQLSLVIREPEAANVALKKD